MQTAHTVLSLVYLYLSFLLTTRSLTLFAGRVAEQLPRRQPPVREAGPGGHRHPGNLDRGLGDHQQQQGVRLVRRDGHR